MKEIKAILSDKERIESFIYAGNAIFTIKNNITGNRFTFRLQKPKEKRGSAEIWFASVLTSPDYYGFLGSVIMSNSRDMFGKNVHNFCYSRKSRINPEAQSMKVIMWFIKALDNDSIPANVEIWHEGKCGRCGRTLTVPESIESGLGPICAEKE